MTDVLVVQLSRERKLCSVAKFFLILTYSRVQLMSFRHRSIAMRNVKAHSRHIN